MIASIQTNAALMMESEAEYLLPPDVIFLPVEDGSARLLDMAGEFHAVSPIGARMLRDTLANGADAAVALIAEDYGVAPQQVQNDLAAFLGELQQKGLLLNQRSRRGRPGNAPGLARLLLRPLLRATHRRLRSPETKARILLVLARLSFALFGWTRTVAVWQDAHAHFPTQPAGERDAETIAALDRAVRVAAASHPVSVACKERAFCSWSLARAAGLHASIVVGVFLFPMNGHCWCEVGTQILGDDRERRDEFTPVGRW